VLRDIWHITYGAGFSAYAHAHMHTHTQLKTFIHLTNGVVSDCVCYDRYYGLDCIY